jgi:hypothetical protein
MPDPNTALMQRIRDAWGLKIAQACAGSSVPPAFVAALIANESGGNVNAKRYEPLVCGHLAAVISGKAAAYDPPGARRALGAQDLQQYLSDSAESAGPGSTPIHRLADLATSYGLTQIMGFHVLMWGLDLSVLRSGADSQLKFTLQMLAFAAQNNALDLAMPDQQTVGEFFDWWNTGRPHGSTFDPNYVPNGIERMRIYTQLSAAAVAPNPGVVQ